LFNWWALLVLSLGYVVVLFAIAYWGDLVDQSRISRFMRSAVYALTLAVYCTSWTFFGAVGSAASNGWGYLPIYVAPMLVIFFGWPLIQRIIAISKRQNLTSIADFIAARYGKAQSLAALVTVIATIGSVPYIALQLKAIVSGFTLISNYADAGTSEYTIALIVAAALAGFAILFGTRKIDVTEHHEGMMMAIAFESVVKLFAFVAIGVFALLLLADSSGEVTSTAARADTVFKLDRIPDAFVTQLILASAAIFCLPRQFHVSIVEAHKDADLKMARWAFPLYLLAFTIFIVPITLAGLKLLPVGGYASDVFVLALPMEFGRDWLTVLAFIGGFSAATSMVIVACVALSTMISNELIMPALLRSKTLGLSARADYSRPLIHIRRGAIIVVTLLAFHYYLAMDESAALASIGLLSFAAAAQFMPLIVLGMYSQRVTRAGAIAGLTTGFVLWAYTLFLPTLARSGIVPADFIEFGLFGLSWLRPEALVFDIQSNPLTHGVAWSLCGNVAVLGIVSMMTRQSMIEKIQARSFAGPIISADGILPSTTRPDLTNADLRELADRFLGERHAERSFRDFAEQQGLKLVPSLKADRRLLQYTERLLAGAIGGASARVVITTALRKKGMEIGDVVALLDETSQAVRFNRQLTEATLENITQGVSVIDANQRLIGWNTRYLELMNYPDGMVHVGESVEDLIRYNAGVGRFGKCDVEKEVAKRIRYLKDGSAYRFESTFIDDKVIEIRGQPMPDGGFVTTYTDITDFKLAEQELVDAKASLEQRVVHRTAELESAMGALSAAKAEAEDANASKTRFLAAAAHDLLQPLNAAKLFAALLVEHRDEMTEQQAQLVARVESGLLSVEDLLGALLDISRLDTAAPVPRPEDIHIQELFTALETQFRETFADQGLGLRFARTDLAVHSDPALLRRILQNFVSNARRYTREGGVLVGCRRRGSNVAIQVIDTGVGIAERDQKAIFEEFYRLSDGAEQTKRGLGLGLAIVDRIARLLGHDISLRSTLGKGSCFEVVVPRGTGTARAPAAPDSVEHVATTAIDDQVVLCVDNEREILDGMYGLLSRWGAAPAVASNLDEALAELDRVHAERGRWPALLLVDYHLAHKVTGLEVIAAIHARTGEEIPAAVVTADHSAEVADRVRSAGHKILYKPIKPAALRALVNSSLSRRAAA
jgi:Na+/proline symporter/signal transduction histidine kinase/ActR/RegA family two-component response regulator